MPDNQRELIHSNTMHPLLEEMVLVGVGVLLVFLGVFSTVPFTSISSVGIGAFLFYTAYESYRMKSGKDTVQTVHHRTVREEEERSDDEEDDD